MVFKSGKDRGPIDCPRCHVGMSVVGFDTYKGRRIEVDACPQCNGIWLDSGELRKVLGDKKLSDYLTKEIGTKTDSPLLCPRDAGLMDIEIADDIEVDVCLTCNGVWLDAGELAGLKELSDMGYEGDVDAKLEERIQEMEADKHRSAVERLFRKMGL